MRFMIGVFVGLVLVIGIIGGVPHVVSLITPGDGAADMPRDADEAATRDAGATAHSEENPAEGLETSTGADTGPVQSDAPKPSDQAAVADDDAPAENAPVEKAAQAELAEAEIASQAAEVAAGVPAQGAPTQNAKPSDGPDINLPETLALVFVETGDHRFTPDAVAAMPTNAKLALRADSPAIGQTGGRDYFVIAPNHQDDPDDPELYALAFAGSRGIYLDDPDRFVVEPGFAQILLYGLSGRDKALVTAGPIAWGDLTFAADPNSIAYDAASTVLDPETTTDFGVAWQAVLDQAARGDTIWVVARPGDKVDEWLAVIVATAAN